MAKIPTKKVVGTIKTKKMRIQVKSDETMGFNLRLKNLYTGLKTPVITVARIITDKKGQSSQPSMKQDAIKTPRKNHKIIPRELLSFTSPPISIGIADFARAYHISHLVPAKRSGSGNYGKMELKF